MSTTAIGTIINNYQTLIGSFLAIIFSIGFWYFKTYVDERRDKKKAEKEIESIFIMAARESEEALKDLKAYVTGVCAQKEQLHDSIHIFVPPKFNRIYIDESRLFALKQYFSFMVSQQIDIAISTAKKFNGYLDYFEIVPRYIFDGNTRLFELGFLSKEEVNVEFENDVNNELDRVELMLNEEIFVAQKNLLRPVVGLAMERRMEVPPLDQIDQLLDIDANQFLSTVKDRD